jgi:hypothetical protein
MNKQKWLSQSITVTQIVVALVLIAAAGAMSFLFFSLVNRPKTELPESVGKHAKLPDKDEGINAKTKKDEKELTEITWEFDCINLRVPYCERIKLDEKLLREVCDDPAEHEVAKHLRKLGVLGPIRENEAKWTLMSGLKPGVRGWRGPGRRYVQELGNVSFGTPVTLPAQEDLDKNLWVKWARRDPEAAKKFWQFFQAGVKKKGVLFGEYCLFHAKEYLESHNLLVSFGDLEKNLSKTLAEYEPYFDR